jgi:hypothetical protein
LTLSFKNVATLFIFKHCRKNFDVFTISQWELTNVDIGCQRVV